MSLYMYAKGVSCMYLCMHAYEGKPGKPGACNYGLRLGIVACNVFGLPFVYFGLL